MRKWILILLLFATFGYAQKYALPIRILSTNGRPINNRTVTLYQNDVLKYTLSYQTGTAGLYYNTTPISPGLYDIKVAGITYLSGVWIGQDIENNADGVTIIVVDSQLVVNMSAVEDSLNEREQLGSGAIVDGSLTYSDVDSAGFFGVMNTTAPLTGGAIQDGSLRSVDMDSANIAGWLAGDGLIQFNSRLKVNTGIGLQLQGDVIVHDPDTLIDTLNVLAGLTGGAIAPSSITVDKLSGSLGRFTLPSNSPLGGGPITIAAGLTTNDMTWSWQTVYDSTAQPMIDSVAASALSVTGNWEFLQGTTLNIFSDVVFHAEGSVTFEEEPTLSGKDFVTSGDFLDYLKDNFGDLSDTVNAITNANLRTVSVNIDSAWINTTDKPLLWKFAQDITIDSVHVLMNPASVSPTLHFSIQLYHNANFATSGTAILADPMDVYNNGLGQGSGTFNDNTVPAGNHVWLQTSNISDKTKGIMVTIYYTIDTSNTAEGT